MTISAAPSSAAGSRMTAGVDALPLDTKARVLLAVQSFSNFTKDNDPHGEHDFGSFSVEGETYFWKIDYYDLVHEIRLRDPRGSGRLRRACSPSCAPTSTEPHPKQRS